MPRRRVPLLVALLPVALLLVAAACSGDDDPAPTNSSAPVEVAPVVVEETPFALTPLEVALLDPGAEPRAPLAQVSTVGDAWTGTIDFDLDVEGFATAAIEAPSRLEVEGVAPDGTITAAYELADVAIEVNGAPSATPEDGLVVSGELTVAPDRTVTEATLGTQAPQEFATLATGIDPRLPFLLFPLPSEPVGLGASWAISGPIQLLGNEVELSVLARLDGLQGDRYDVGVVVSLTFEDPIDLELTGQGRLRGSLLDLGPGQGSISVAGTGLLPGLPEASDAALDLTVAATR